MRPTRFHRNALRSATAAFGLFGALAAMPVDATTQRTFVASSGNDANPCSLTLPCRGFAAAIVQTADGGEVIVLDSAGYGPATISQAITITAPAGIYAGISVASGNGITVNAPSAKVVLRGLTINGIGGTQGISHTDGDLHVERCTVSGVSGAGIASLGLSPIRLFVHDTIVRDNGGSGISIVGAVTATLEHVVSEINGNAALFGAAGATIHVANSTFSQSGNQAGIFVNATASSFAITTLVVESSLIDSNDAEGMLAIAGTGSNQHLNVIVSRSTISNSSPFNGMNVTAGSGASAFASVYDSSITSNLGNGLFVSGAGATIVAGRNNITRNGSAGLSQAASGVLLSAHDNLVDGNASPTSGSIGSATLN